MTLDIFVTMPTIPERHERYAFPIFDQLKEIFGQHRVAIYDDLDRSLLLSHLKSWRYGYAHGTKWVAVCEDDIVFARNIGGKLSGIMDEAEYYKYQVVNLYSNYQADIDALNAGERWRKHPGRSFRNEQFLIMHRDIVGMLVECFKGALLDPELFDRYNKHWSDVFIGDFLGKNKIDVHIVLPNLVDHMNEKSSIGHPRTIAGRPRKSRTFQP